MVIAELCVYVQMKVASGSGWTNQSDSERDTLFGIIWESRVNSDQGNLDKRHYNLQRHYEQYDLGFKKE
jgi:hypothetical protein